MKSKQVNPKCDDNDSYKKWQWKTDKETKIIPTSKRLSDVSFFHELSKEFNYVTLNKETRNIKEM
jgi:hypothetical protein